MGDKPMTNGNRGRDDEHNTICAFDIEGFGGKKRTRPEYVALREGMYTAVERAFEQSGISLADCYHEGAGDSILALAPSTVGKSTFAGDVPAALVAALMEHNAEHPPAEQLRLRMALHAGEITRDAHGVAGQAIIHTARLLDSPPLKDGLRESTGVLAIIASAWFYDEVIRQYPEFAPEEYERTAVTVKETSGFGWIRLPDYVRSSWSNPPGEPREESPGMLEIPNPTGPLVPSFPASGVLTTPMRPASPRFYQVVEAIEAIPCMQGEHTRSLVVDQLGFAGAIRYFANRRAHVTSILRTCLDFEDGVVQLVTAISGQEPNASLPVSRLIALLTEG
jgi:effector-associated domain 2 (EAD2)-containing protein